MNATAPLKRNGPPLLRLSGISLRISGLEILSDVNLDVDAGQIVSLIGPNGAGKTTAFNIISGYMRPSAGSVTFLGQDITDQEPHTIAGLGLVRSFQRTNIFGNCTVFENLLTAFHMQGHSGLIGALFRLPAFLREEQTLKARTREMLDFLDLEHRANDLASNLSYGEQRLLGVGIALAAQPKLLLLDEPAAGLNPSETEDFKQMVRRVADSGITILLVEHDMHMVMAISDYIVVLNQGHRIADGAPADIQNNPEVIRAYLGSGLKRAQT